MLGKPTEATLAANPAKNSRKKRVDIAKAQTQIARMNPAEQQFFRNRAASKENRHLFMYRADFVALCSLLFLVATSLGDGPLDEKAVPPDTVITLQRGGCEKRCAVYKLILFADGTLIYDGQYYVRRNGLVLDKVDVAAVRKLIEDFQAIGYFNLKEQYGYKDEDGCNSVVSDAPIAMTSIVTGGKSKGIIHHHRCGGPVPEQLTQLEDKIDKVANTVRWIK